MREKIIGRMFMQSKIHYKNMLRKCQTKDEENEIDQKE